MPSKHDPERQTSIFEEHAYGQKLEQADEMYWSDQMPLTVLSNVDRFRLTTWLHDALMGVWRKVRPGHKSDKS